MPKPNEVVLSEYRIFETDEFTKKLGKITQSHRKVVESKLHAYVYPQLKTAPCYGPNIKKLKGYSPETWRYRIGNYRIFYFVDESEKIINILTIDQRKDAYR
ncbi:MAG: type II toxin-antitoxin system RelE/ParE family toxin [Spartobacteria bacterium]|nr:type II toxin-antitoxin system RelE/ParE family toxin [Spartobacteria bacterium]